MEKIEARIKNRLLNNKKELLDTQEIDLYLKDITVIGYDRFMQLVDKISRTEPSRKLALIDVITVFHMENQIRTFLMQHISTFELMLRSILGEYYLLWYGIHGYKKASFFEDKETHDYLLYKVKKQLKMQPEYEVTALELSEDMQELPIWEALEISTFQMLTIFYKIFPQDYQSEISQVFSLEPKVFFSWIEFLLVVRNACAHQGLLFGREFSRSTILPSSYKQTPYSANYVLSHFLNLNFKDINYTIEKYIQPAEYEWVKPYYGILREKQKVN